jgi:hypothetical protein
MQHLGNLVLTLTLLLPTAAAFATDPPATEDMAPPQAAASAGAYLGVFVEPLPPALAAQLPPNIPEGQGVLVGRIEPGSPADAAGLRPYDLLLSYNDQKLFTPEQLVRLVATDKPQQTVKLQIARAGNLQTLDLTLGMGKTREFARLPQWVHPHQMPQQAFPPRVTQDEGKFSESFESLSIKSLDKGRFKASIEYLDADGNKQHHEFEGTRQELHKQIRQAKNLPPQARRQLLNALGLRGHQPMSDRTWPGAQGPFNFEELMEWWRQNHAPELDNSQP